MGDLISAAMWRNLYPTRAWCYNPWTGTYRDTRDVDSDPQGLAIVPPGESLKPAASPAATAPELLGKARKHMEDRAATYDKPEGERSMANTVDAFNVITGRDLLESEGWLLMQILKDVRDRQRKDAHVDSLEDCIAYAALKAEARLGGR